MSILKGKTAVVTGSTSGIGLGCARAFAGAGANIVLNGIGAPADVERTRSAIESDFGVRAIYSPANMAEPMEIAGMISLAEKTFGRVDVLVNNAGVQHVSPIEDFPVEKWDAVIAINLSSAFHAIRAVTAGMKQRGWGRIINTASAHSLVASPFKSAYVAAKHGIAGLTKTVALELARSEITCNCISPGYVWTPLVERQIPETMRARNMSEDQVINDVLLAAQPTKEFVTVEQVASLALFLCGQDAAQITGANLSIDGGASAHSLVASPFKSAYVAAKHGIAGLTKTVALELAQSRITCNCISPGYVWTPLVEKQIPETMKARNMSEDQVIKDVLLAAQPTKEFVTVEQIASLALFLCSEDAAQITGANLPVDGGWTAA